MEANAGKSFQMPKKFNIFPRNRPHFKLVPVQYWEYEYGLFAGLHRERFNSEYLHVTEELTTNAANAGILACNLNRTEKAIKHVG